MGKWLDLAVAQNDGDKSLTNPVGTALTKPIEPSREKDVISKFAQIAKEWNHPVDDLLDWYRDDMEDLAQKSTADLRFIVSEYIDNLKFYGREIPDEEPEIISHPSVRCGDCQHFKPIDHPFLGHCLQGVPESPAGMWSTSQRGCDKYSETVGRT